MKLNSVHQKIVDAIVQKAKRDCPDSLSLISLYGSLLTGENHSKSDLDLTILIKDEKGRCLSECFILDDAFVGYDIYCTTWEDLERLAECASPHMSKLMDSEILYCSNEDDRAEFLRLREKAKKTLSSPVSMSDIERAKPDIQAAEHYFTKAMIKSKFSEVRCLAAFTVNHLINAVAIANKRYFSLGVARTFDELKTMSLPNDFQELIFGIISSDDIDDIKKRLTKLIQVTDEFLSSLEVSFAVEKSAPCEENLRGTYEEMVSNWWNKMLIAAKNNNAYLSFMSIAFMHGMLSMMSDEIYGSVKIAPIDVMEGYDPFDLTATAESFWQALEKYRTEYDRAGVNVCRYRDVDDFVEAYLSK